MKKSSVVVVTALASACMVALATPGSTVIELFPLEPQAVPEAGEPRDESPQRWFVELKGAPAADGGTAAALRAEKKAFRDAARTTGLRYREHYAYDTLFNGFSVVVDRTQLSTLARLPGVKAIYPVETVTPPAPGASNPDLLSALAMTGADVAQNELGLDGRGVRVAVMDSGIDYDHPDFGGNGSNGSTAFPTGRVVAGWDFVGDAFNADPASPFYNPVPVPDANPDDCGGHGTHVAGIIGADGAVKGVAPKASLGAYRVFGCEGSTTADVMMAAMERVLADDMDVLNMSLGSAFQWPEYPTAKAATRLVNKGVVVVASAGNSGASGLYSTGAPSVGDKVISVASFENTNERQRYFTISPDGTQVGFNPASSSPQAPASGTWPMARTGTTASTADACAALPPGSLAGKVALVRRGTCTFHQKARNAQNAGALAVVLYDNVTASPLSLTVFGTPAITIPVVGTTRAFGELINGRLDVGPVDLTWTGAVGSFTNVAALVSGFSAYGMSPDLQLKPDIGAPGGRIYSTYPLEIGGHTTLSGTSMASPHVAGAAALLLQAAPNTPSQAVAATLQNSAIPKTWSRSPGLGLLEMVHRQGAGMLRIDDAVTAATRIVPGKLSLGESEAGPASQVVTLRNTGSTPVTYTFSSTNAVSTGAGTFNLSYFLGTATAVFATPSVTLLPGAVATVGVTITAPAEPAGGHYGGYLEFTPDDGSATLRVPFAGLIGDYQSKKVLVPTADPWLAKLVGNSYFPQTSGASYTMAGNDVPFFLIHFDHQARLVRMDVTDAVSGKSWHRALETQYFGRNSTPFGFFAFSWDGSTTAGNKLYVVPNGQYVVKLSVLKALGDAANPAHWETWSSPVVTIARP